MAPATTGIGATPPSDYAALYYRPGHDGLPLETLERHTYWFWTRGLRGADVARMA